jgi:heme/copper-type cytochrome/quinol oxidase subunit 1
VNINKVLTIRQFLVIFFGVNVTFFPMHFLGIQGMPRRYREFSPVFSYWHRVASFGRVVSIVGVRILFYI